MLYAVYCGRTEHVVAHRAASLHRAASCALPNPIERLDHPHLERIIDTRTWDSDVPGVGFIKDGTLLTYHVTDDPDAAMKALRRGRLMASYGESGRFAELGPGFYTSGYPEFWVGRAPGKWEFLKRLTDPQIDRLSDALRTRIDYQRHEQRYITESEYESALRLLGHVQMERSYPPDQLVRLADQPYNIAFWKPEFLLPLGIEPGRRPRVLELRLVGHFAEVNRSHPDPVLLRRLRKLGVSGVFTRGGFATNPELALWDARSIVEVREIALRR